MTVASDLEFWGNPVSKLKKTRRAKPNPLATSRTRRARLVTEFEHELGVDHDARADAAYREQRWIRIKTGIVWTIALIFFAIACLKLYQMGQNVEKPFSNIDPVGDIMR